MVLSWVKELECWYDLLTLSDIFVPRINCKILYRTSVFVKHLLPCPRCDNLIPNSFNLNKVMESLEHAMKRDAPIIAEYLGGAVNCDAYHMTDPRSDGLGVSSCIKQSLEDAGVAPEEVIQVFSDLNIHSYSYLFCICISFSVLLV